MKFRLSRSEPLRTLKQNLPRYEALGMNVEIRLTDADFNRAISVKDFEELERELRGRKISAFCHLPFHGLNLSCPDSRVMEYSREVIREGLEIGTILGVSQMQVSRMLSTSLAHLRDHLLADAA